jgi:hypothetical protein
MLRFCAVLERFFAQWWIRYIVKPIVITAPPAICVAYFDLGLDKAGFNLPPTVSGFLAQNEIYILAGSLIFVYMAIVAGGVLEYCANKADDGVDNKALLSLFTALELAVGEKVSRFQACWRQAALHPRRPASEIFREITQPEQQIVILAQGLLAFFGSITSGVSFKVTIASVENGKPVGWVYSLPATDPPTTPWHVLQSPDSSICRAVQTRSIVIVEDLKAEAIRPGHREYVAEDPTRVKPGSLICCPICDANIGTPYAVTVVANVPRYFLKAKEPIYDWVLKRFSLRIRLERYLLELKQSAS